jgi:hypothetical protein
MYPTAKSSHPIQARRKSFFFDQNFLNSSEKAHTFSISKKIVYIDILVCQKQISCVIWDFFDPHEKIKKVTKRLKK